MQEAMEYAIWSLHVSNEYVHNFSLFKVFVMGYFFLYMHIFDIVVRCSYLRG